VIHDHDIALLTIHRASPLDAGRNQRIVVHRSWYGFVPLPAVRVRELSVGPPRSEE
jgi:hypothetical protein